MVDKQTIYCRIMVDIKAKEKQQNRNKLITVKPKYDY